MIPVYNSCEWCHFIRYSTRYLFLDGLQVANSELYIFDIWKDNLQSFNREKNEASVPVFYADWTSVPDPRTSSLRRLDVGFIPLLPKELPYMANNDEYIDEYNDEYLCRVFLSVSIFGRGYHSRYQNFEFTGGKQSLFLANFFRENLLLA